MIPYGRFSALAEIVYGKGAKKATEIVNDKEVITATRRRKLDGRSKHHEILFTVGPPNYAIRKVIKKDKRQKTKTKMLIKWPDK